MAELETLFSRRLTEKPKPEPEPNPCENYIPDTTLDGVECQPNQYPEYLHEPMPMTVVGTETGSYKSINGLLNASMKCADRVLIMTPWGNYVVFRVPKPDKPIYFLYDGCTCHANSFRYLDLRAGTAGFLTFYSTSSLICYMLSSRYRKEKLNLIRKPQLDYMCIEKRPTGEEEEEGEGEIVESNKKDRTK